MTVVRLHVLPARIVEDCPVATCADLVEQLPDRHAIADSRRAAHQDVIGFGFAEDRNAGKR